MTAGTLAPRLSQLARPASARLFHAAPLRLHAPKSHSHDHKHGENCGCAHTSEHGHGPAKHGHLEAAPGNEPPPAEGQADGRLFIGFTCKVCNTRSYHTMSRLAYTKGVVIIACPGCKAKHLMADHLGWFDSQTKVGTIEEILEKAGRGSEIERGSVGVPMFRMKPQEAVLGDGGDGQRRITIEDAFSFLPKDVAEREKERQERAQSVLNYDDTVEKK